MEVLVKSPNNPEVTFQSLSALDLTGKDLELVINNVEKIHHISIKDFPLNSFKLDYKANYKLGIYSVFGDSDPISLEQKITDKLKSFASNWESDDYLNTQNFLQSNIINNEYWERVLNVQLIDQTFQVKA